MKRFAQKFGVEALLDRESKRFQELGLGVARYSDDRWLEKLVDEPMMLRVPLTRCQPNLTIGLAESACKEWTA